MRVNQETLWHRPDGAKITLLDIRMMVSVMICCLTAASLDYFGLRFSYGEEKLEIIQKMTACITCLLCCQENTDTSKKAGRNRLLITVIGGMVGMYAAALDSVTQNEWFMVGITGMGVLITLFLCKLAKVPYVNCRIGAFTFILVLCTRSGRARVWYAFFRFISTFYGVLTVLFVTWLFTARNKAEKRDNKNA